MRHPYVAALLVIYVMLFLPMIIGLRLLSRYLRPKEMPPKDPYIMEPHELINQGL